MDYQGGLHMLCETFRKCRVPVAFADRNAPLTINDDLFHLIFGEELSPLPQTLPEQMKERTIYRITSPYCLHYILLLLPRTAQDSLLILGPYLPNLLSEEQVLEMAETFQIPPHRRKLLENYYSSIAVLPETSHLFSMLDTFGELLWGSNGFTLEELRTAIDQPLLPSPENTKNQGDLLAQMRLMEERYATENALIYAVSKGQVHKGAAIMESIASMPFEKRLDDPLRNLKNYSIIMNTILRKAAESGGVHPFYLDDVSSSFASRIEQVPSLSAAQALMSEMFRTYCYLVRQRSMKQYSAVVQKTLIMIDADLSADLSLSKLAQAQNISAGYLSAIFKKETDQTVTDYINSERMQLAAHLLQTTTLQVQTIAAHCGMLDVQYFSKVFKKYMKKTPKAYRESFQ
ncbi:MAG: helix-turn-helix domain-containing protein [Clostridia bacterium]|nr:helix-turn-helix domain-containing protein [Clostridia bacterium]